MTDRDGAQVARGANDAAGGGYAREVRTFYRREVARHGYTSRGLGFRRESQRKRFDILAGVGDMDGASVLDVGAGLGDFLLYLWSRGVTPDYTGIDLCEDLARQSEHRFESETRRPNRFVAGDVLDHTPARPYDYVVASGIFGLETAETEARIAPTLDKLLSMCCRGVAVNFLSARAARHAPRRLYVEPREALEIAWRLTPAVTLRHDYLPNDFTLYMYREPRWPVISRRRGGCHEWAHR